MVATDTDTKPGVPPHLPHGRARYVHFALRQADGRLHLERWGIEAERYGGIFLHRFETPDPGIDLHDHPWGFVSFIWGGYVQERLRTWEGVLRAMEWSGSGPVGRPEHRRWLSVMPLGDCHRITKLLSKVVWSVVIHGPHKRDPWGYYTPDGWIDEKSYDLDARRCGLHVEDYTSRVLIR